MTLTFPTVHLNGTSKDELQRQVCDAHWLGSEFLRALGEAAPNSRDYYPQGDDAWRAVSAEHKARLQAVSKVLAELEAIGGELI